MADSPVCPPMPAGSVDLNALHEAARKGRLEKLVEDMNAPAKPDEPEQAAPPAREAK